MNRTKMIFGFITISHFMFLLFHRRCWDVALSNIPLLTERPHEAKKKSIGFV